MLHPANHALTLMTAEGLEVMIHIGLDTINLKGQGFTPKQVDAVAETRLRVVPDDDTQVDESGLQTNGVDGVMRLPNRIMRLIVGLNADQYAAEMHGQLAGA